MVFCPELVNVTIAGTSATWGSVSRHALPILSIGSYFRPDKGGALLPWIYTIIAIIVHAPVVFLRVTRWDIVQTWCIVATLFTVIVYIQAFISTGFAADKILVWTPLILVIDAGSMLQVFFLVLEARTVFVEGRIILLDPENGESKDDSSLRERLYRLRQGMLRRLRRQHVDPESEEHSLEALASPGSTTTNGGSVRNVPITFQHPAIWQDPAVYAALTSAILFIAVIVLQILGLQKAVTVRYSGQLPMVTWCSPMFQPFGISIADGDCHVYAIDQSSYRGVGCVRIPGVWQRQWLTGTVIGTAMSLIFEAMDLAILSLVRSTAKFRGVKMKRPWTTMVSGLVVLGITLFYGLQYSFTLPPAISERVTVAINIDGVKSLDVNLTTAGLRGAMIGWNDGLFESWGTTYVGG